MKTFGRTTLGLVGALAIALLPTLVFGDDAAAAAPTPNKGDTAWMLTSTALVLLMSVPALGLFYGGLVRSKNMLSVLMQVFVGFSLVTVLWCVYGYSLAFTAGNAFFGGSRLFLNGTFDPAKGAFSYAATFSKAHADVRARLRRVPGDVRGDHLLPDPRLDRRARSSSRACCCSSCCGSRSATSRSRTWSGIWDGPDAYTTRRARRRANADGRLIWQMGRARLRGRHGRAHQRRCRGPRRRVRARQARRLRQRVDDAAQPHDDDDRRVAAVVRMVRVQRGLRARGERLGRARVHEHVPRDRVRGPLLDRSSSGWSRVSRRCSAPRRAPSRASSRSRRLPATSASRARS